MKAIKRVIIGAVALLIASRATTFAIEGLRIEIQCPDVVLSWPSIEGESYIVQHRPDLSTNSTWVTLTNSLPAESGTNWAYFVHPGMLQCQTNDFSGGGGGSGSPPSPDSATGEESWTWTHPMVTQKEGKSVVPLALYPIGIDLTGHVIIWPDGSTDEWSAELVAKWRAVQQEAQGDPQTEDADGSEPDCGFYRVVRNGVHLVGVTNGMTLSGIVTVLFEAGNDSGTLNSLSLNEDGTPLGELSMAQSPFGYSLSLILDTTRMSNGVHEVYAHAAWYIPGADNPYFEATSTPITINVFNEISFPNWMSLYGQLYDSLYITAQSAHAEADWYIDVYGAESGYIGTFGGHTDDGNIEAVWNLIGPPPNFVSYANEPYFEFVVTTYFDDEQEMGLGPESVGSASATSPPTRKNRDQWAAPGDWVVANQVFWENWVGGENLNTMTDSFVGMAEAFGRTVRPTHPYGEAFRIRYNDGNEVSSWQAFRQALYHPNSRNLFYSGHGGANGIGYNAANTNLFIPRSEIAAALRTVPAGQTNRHAFRFVFLDGCQTANGRLPEAFGIVQEKELPFTHYYNSGERYSAFVGWNKSPTAGYANQYVNVDHWKFIMNFQYAWLMEGQGVREALNRSKHGPLNNNVDINPKHLTVFGYRDLGPNQHNGL